MLLAQKIKDEMVLRVPNFMLIQEAEKLQISGDYCGAIRIYRNIGRDSEFYNLARFYDWFLGQQMRKNTNIGPGFAGYNFRKPA